MGDQVHGTANSYDSSCCANRTTTGTLGPIYSHLAQRQAAGWQTGRGQERCSLRKAVLLMQPGMPGSPGWATLAPRVGINVPSLHTGRQKQSIPCQCSGLSSQSRASERGGLALMTKCSGRAHGQEQTLPGGESCGLREPSFYPGFTDLKLGNLLHSSMPLLGSKPSNSFPLHSQRRLTFLGRPRNFYMYHPLPSPLTPILLSLSPSLLSHQPCYLCAVSNSLICLYPRTFALAVPSSWKTSPSRYLHDLLLHFIQF